MNEIKEISKKLQEINLLQAQNKKLKEQNRDLQKALLNMCPKNDCEQCKHLDLYIKYKQTLQEIKAIAENCYDPADKENDGFYTILQKITKAESEG